MALCVYLGIGVATGGVVGVAGQAGVGSTIAVGCLGSLLGRASAGWLGSSAANPSPAAWLAAALGAATLVAVWTAARRLFLNPPGAG